MSAEAIGSAAGETGGKASGQSREAAGLMAGDKPRGDAGSETGSETGRETGRETDAKTVSEADGTGAQRSVAPALYIPASDARTAASLMLLRDGEGNGAAGGGLEVLMLRRAERGSDDPRSGAAVFPGGVLDPQDRVAHPCCIGPDDATASRLLGVAAGGLDYLVAAVRETFEEVGLLLAIRRDAMADILSSTDSTHNADSTDSAAAPLDVAALAHWRDKLHAGTTAMAEFCRAEGLCLDLRGLVYASHWLTPPGTIKRFDTRFFAALAPAGQQAVPDLGETVELMWITPRAALQAARGLKLLPVTRRTLQDLGRHATAAAALDAFRARSGQVTLTMPRRVVTAKGPGVVLPHEPAYAEVGKLDPMGRADVWNEITPGRAVRLSSRVVRVTAPNPGVMTGPGTNSYLVGEGDAWAVIDPGPASAPHLQALLDAAAALSGPDGEQAGITRIFVTHTHSDHSPGAAALTRASGAPVFGRLPAFAERQDASITLTRELQHGERIRLGPETTLRVIHTPGHASNHLCYLLEEEQLLFSGDHVMQGSTVVINPPDGDMLAYLQALQALLDEDIAWLAPGHGFLVDQPRTVIRALIAHRLKREAKAAAALRAAGPCTLDALLPRVYDDVAPALHPVARRSLLAHLLKLQADGSARCSAGDDGLWSAA